MRKWEVSPVRYKRSNRYPAPRTGHLNAAPWLRLQVQLSQREKRRTRTPGSPNPGLVTFRSGGEVSELCTTRCDVMARGIERGRLHVMERSNRSLHYGTRMQVRRRIGRDQSFKARA